MSGPDRKTAARITVETARPVGVANDWRDRRPPQHSWPRGIACRRTLVVTNNVMPWPPAVTLRLKSTLQLERASIAERCQSIEQSIKRRRMLTPTSHHFPRQRNSDQHIGASRDLFRMIVTHPDMDHMTGLHRLATDTKKNIYNFWHSGLNNFNLEDTDWAWGRFKQEDWDKYKEFRTSKSMPTAIKPQQRDSRQFWNEDSIELWAPIPELEARAIDLNQANIVSMVLKISYAGRSILLSGDALGDETWEAIYPNIDMTGVNVLKASHHGRRSGYHQPSVKEMAPWLTITSVGDREYDATPRYRQYSQYTVSLRAAGDIKIRINDNGSINYWPLNLADHWKPRTQ